MIRPMIKAKMIPIQPKRNTRNAASWYMGIAFLIKSKSIIYLQSFLAFLTVSDYHLINKKLPDILRSNDYFSAFVSFYCLFVLFQYTKTYFL